MGFSFRLEKIIKLRRRAVDQQALAVADAGRTLAEIGRKLEDLENEISRQKEDPRCMSQRAISVQDLVSKTCWLQHLMLMQETYLEAHDQAEVNLAGERHKLTEAWRDLEVLVKLKERQHEQWRAQQAKLEKKELDEIGQIRADRRRRESASR